MAPPKTARPRVAYDLGRRGEALPADWRDDGELAGAYEMGVADRDAAEAGSSRRNGAPPAKKRAAQRPADSPAADAEGEETGGFRRGVSAGAGVPWSRHPLSRGGGGGLFLGIIGYCVGRAFLAEGPYGIWRWYSAKFMNRVLPRQAGGQGSATGDVSPSSAGGKPDIRLAS